MDELIKEYAQILRKIYYEETIGVYTFEGVLSEFAERVREKTMANCNNRT